METIFAVGQTVSLFLVIIFFIAVISAKTEKSWPGLALCLLMLAASIWAGVSFQKEFFFLCCCLQQLALGRGIFPEEIERKISKKVFTITRRA